MTESIFIALHAEQGINYLNIPGRLHLNVNPAPGSAEQGIITGVVVHVEAKTINGSSNNENGQLNIESVLEQVETIQFSFNGDPYTLNILTKSFYSSGNPFFYFSIEPVFIADIYNANSFEPSLENVTFTPYLADLNFIFSDSNTLVSNASEQRDSIRIMQSDRLESLILPKNSASLYDETAEKASVQDSLYYDTGWTNSRYNGSKTDPSDNAGIDPAISGRSFKGEAFSIETTTDYICQSDNRLQQEFFHNGKTQLPAYSLGVPTSGSEHFEPLTALSLALSGNGTTLTHGNVEVGELTTGDIITINTGSRIVEYMEVVESAPNTTVVKRDIFNSLTIGRSYQSNSKVYRVEKYDIYNLGDSGQTRLNSVGIQRIYIEGTNSIVNTNKEGMLVSQSFCPIFINYVDNP